MFVRVTSWIVHFASEETIHEITLNNTNEALSLNQRFLKFGGHSTIRLRSFLIVGKFAHGLKQFVNVQGFGEVTHEPLDLRPIFI